MGWMLQRSNRVTVRSVTFEKGSLRNVLFALFALSGGTACGGDDGESGAPLREGGSAGGSMGDDPSDGSSGGSLGGSVSDFVTVEPDGPLTVSLEIAEADQERLEADPWNAPDVLGAFVDGGGTRYEGIELNYRGAYQLGNLVRSGGLRNWKVKFGKQQPYKARREWNFNYEPHIRAELSWSLMKDAGVRVPEADHVLLQVNGEMQGVYLRFTDVDSKGWVHDAFGSDQGDLFKAAYDIPDEPPYFATLETLGSSDEDYFLHYNKKLNNNDVAATDFSTLREFIAGLNETADENFETWLSSNFDTERFISYLVVASFICNWDSYPYRPKNYWMYQHPDSLVWSFVPWDLDATFQPYPVGNYPLSTSASIYQEFDAFEGIPSAVDAEGSERPLVRRMMSHPAFRDAYLARYRQLVAGILSESSLKARAQEMQERLSGYAPIEDEEDLIENYENVVEFIELRSEAVTSELSAF
jgi:spore coat protein CotH